MMKKNILLIISLLFIFIASNVTAMSGSGTEGDPYQITTCVELGQIDNDFTADYKLMNDIDCVGINFEPMGTWTGSSGTGLTGVLDGNSKSILNLDIDKNGTSNVGIFVLLGHGSSSTDCEVKDLKIINPTIATGTYGAVLSGIANICYIHDIYIENPEVDSNGILNSAFIGFMRNDVIAERIGVSGGYVTNNGNAGGLTASLGWASGSTINNSYATATITSPNTAGGLIGSFSSFSDLHNSWTTGNVIGLANEKGAIIGTAGTGQSSGCYWDTTVSPQNNACGTNGDSCVFDNIVTYEKTTTQMQQEATFVDWDFADTWYIDEGVDYAELRSFLIFDKPLNYVNLIGVSDDGFSINNINPITIDYIVSDNDSVTLNCSLYYSEEFDMNNKILADNDFSVLNNTASKLYITPDFFDVYDDFEFYYQVECNDGLFFEDSNIRQILYTPIIRYSEADIPKATINVIVKSIIFIGFFISILIVGYLISLGKQLTE